jgi:Mn-dependent DtxR family transcriptional regulator
VLILMGVMIGEAEGKLLSAYKLAGFIGIPRATVMRRLARLQRDGLVERDHRKAYSLTEKGRLRLARVP